MSGTAHGIPQVTDLLYTDEVAAPTRKSPATIRWLKATGDEDVARCDRMAIAAALGWAHHACAVSAEDQFANFAHTSGLPRRRRD